MARNQEAFDALVRKIHNNNPDLTEVKIIKQELTLEDIQKLAEALENNTQVKYLDLSFNSIRNVGAQLLAKALANKQNLKHLNLKFASIGAEGAKALAIILPTLVNLQTLILDANPITLKGSGAIVQAVKTHPSLEEFSLQYCRLGDKLAEQCCEILDNNRVIKRLILAVNEFTPKGMLLLSQHLQSCPNLELLNLWSNCRGNFFDPVMYDVEKFYTDPVVTSGPLPPSIDLFQRVKMCFGYNPVMPKFTPSPITLLAPTYEVKTDETPQYKPEATPTVRRKLHIMC